MGCVSTAVMMGGLRTRHKTGRAAELRGTTPMQTTIRKASSAAQTNRVYPPCRSMHMFRNRSSRFSGGILRMRSRNIAEKLSAPTPTNRPSSNLLLHSRMWARHAPDRLPVEAFRPERDAHLLTTNGIAKIVQY